MAQVLPCLNEDKFIQDKIEKAQVNYKEAIELAKTELPEKEGTGGMQEAIVGRSIQDF